MTGVPNVRNRASNRLEPGRLCRLCPYRGSELRAKVLLLRVTIGLTLGLPAAWITLQALGLFQLDYQWAAVYCVGILTFTAAAFRLPFKLPARSPFGEGGEGLGYGEEDS